jgi:hypothetical protein
MAFNEELDLKIYAVVSQWKATKKKMFGGTCYLMNGNMLCGVYKDFLILRLGPVEGERALAQARVKPFDITGKAMKGWVMVEAADCEGPVLNNWLSKAREYVENLPPR